MSDIPTKEFEADDPMELRGVECDGDVDFMIACIAEEYLTSGWRPEEVFGLFESPEYPMLHSLLQSKGGGAIRRQIERAAARCGVFRVRVVEAPPEPELVTILPAAEGGSRHE